MKPQRTAFMPVTSDIDDDELERLARDKGVGAMVKASDAQPPPEPKAGQGAMPAASRTAPPATRPAPRAEAKPPEHEPTPRSRMKTVNLELPDYVWTDLKIRAAHAQTSVRHIVMAALQAHGVTIADVDMVEDGRRLRS